MKTADEFYNEDLTPLQNMIEFAKMHVEAALEAADGEVPLPYSHGVLNCYPESKII